MTERGALILTFVGILAAGAMLFVGLELLGAADQVLGLAYFVLLSGGAYMVSEVVMHYGDKRRRR